MFYFPLKLLCTSIFIKAYLSKELVALFIENNNNNNNKYLIITPLKGLFSIILKSPFPLSQLRIPTGRRQTSWLFTKRGEFAPWITEDKFIQ